MIVKYIVRNMQKISYYGKTHIYLQNDLFSVKIQMWVNQIKPSTIKEIFLCCVISSNTYIWCVFWIICHKGSVGLLDAFLTTIFWCLKNSAFTTSLGQCKEFESLVPHASKWKHRIIFHFDLLVVHAYLYHQLWFLTLVNVEIYVTNHCTFCYDINIWISLHFWLILALAIKEGSKKNFTGQKCNTIVNWLKYYYSSFLFKADSKILLLIPMKEMERVNITFSP